MRITIVGCGDVVAALARQWRRQGTVELTLTATLEEGREALVDCEVVVFCLADTDAATYRNSCRTLVDLMPLLPQLRQIVSISSRVLLESEGLLQGCHTAERAVCLLRLGDGGLHGSWIHRHDVVRAIAAAVEHRWDGIVNVVDDEPLTEAERQQRVCGANGWEPVLLRRLDDSLFRTVADQARQSPRLRRNHNLHAEADPVQRFLNVLQPGTYVRPHRHRRGRPGAGFECFVVLRGAVGLLLLDERGEVIHQERLEAGGPVSGIDLAEDQIHTLVALEPDTVMFEIKEGPYRPASDKDFLTAFPAEGTAAATSLEAAWRKRFAED
ncbi:MAG: WbuC family cupin fold metalloprotein [Prochlorococcaceae cyanobacterium]|jgi:cupin fold WbuC family metalloprotein